jgi:RNA polymerase sigma-70 factor (ECF subfamily)
MNEDRQQDFLRLFLRHQEELRAFIGSLVRDRHMRDDILQESALVLWRKFDEYDPARSFGAWARGVTAHKIMQSFDRIKRCPLQFSPNATQAILMACQDSRMDISEEQEALQQCLGNLPDRSRNLVSMRYEQGLKLREIAEQTASSLDAVHKTLSRIRQLLRKCVEDRLALEQEMGS